MARRFALAAVLLGAVGALCAEPVVAVGVNAPRGARFSLALTAPDGGVVWTHEVRSFRPEEGRSRTILLPPLDFPITPRHRFTVRTGPRDAGCEGPLTRAEGGQALLVTVKIANAACTVESWTYEPGVRSAVSGLRANPVGDFPPYEPPMVHSAEPR